MPTKEPKFLLTSMLEDGSLFTKLFLNKRAVEEYLNYRITDPSRLRHYRVYKLDNMVKIYMYRESKPVEYTTSFALQGVDDE